ncbi:MAG: bifunctional diguanylate cyclase/phosphodiesterase [Thauera sp.]
MPSPATRTTRDLAPSALHTVVVITLVAGLLIAFLLFSYQSTKAAIEVRASNEAELLAIKLEHTLNRTDMSLAFIRELYSTVLHDPAAPANGEEHLRHYLKKLAHRFPEALSILVTDAEGKVRASTLPELPNWHIGDREYFQRARSAPAEATQFSSPLLARSSPVPTVVGFQALKDPAGAFDGVVAIALNVGHFESLLSGIAAGSQGMASIRRSDDSRLVIRWPEAPAQIDKPASHIPPFKMVQDGVRKAVVRYVGASDQVERIVAFQALDDYPFFVSVGHGVREQYASWRQNGLVAAGVALFAIALLLTLQYRLNRSRAQLAQSEHHLGTLIDSRQDATCAWLPDTTLLSCNARYAELVGKDEAEARGLRWIDFIPAEHQESALEAIHTLQSDGGALTTEREMQRADGCRRWIRWLDQPVFDSDGQCVEIRSIGQDITEEKHNALRLRQLAQAVEQSPNSIVITNTQAVIEYVNEAFTQVTGFAPEEVVGKNPRVLNAGKTPRATYEDLWATLTQGEVWRGEFHNTRKDGSTYIELATIAPIKQADGEVSHYVAVKEDITARREAEARIQQLAYNDTLTGLPNRSLMQDRLKQSILASQRSGTYGMLLLLDVDQFKVLNDTQGHDAGDALLRALARRLQATLRADDTVARLGGDDFAVIVEALDADADLAVAHAERIAEHLHDALLQPFDLGLPSGPYRSTPSIGITLFHARTTSPKAVFQQAEVALYKAKEDGRNAIRFFNERMQAVVDARAGVELQLRTALADGGFRLFYQPQINRDGRIIGAEALIRCFDAGGRMISPAAFIPLAEETGLIVPIGEWVLDTACAQLNAWQQDPATHHCSLAINVSAKQFHQPDFLDKVRGAIERHRILPGRLKIELTESVVLGDLEATVDRMRQIKALGVRFALDDFGTGYSSLSYLKRLPFDQLKIDQIFVRDMGTDNSSEAIVRAILAISRSLELEVVAEGVETPEQHELLLTRGCEMFQGYLFGRPTPIADWPASL